MPYSAVFVGNESLVEICASRWIQDGNEIRLFASSNKKVLAWARSHNIPVATLESLASDTNGLTFDYLFSISNLHILPEAVINAPIAGAINFHDGPLPYYKGVNTPAWAILNAESSHGVAFHFMQKEVDAGAVIASHSFQLLSSETSLTANAKCFESALDCFSDVLTSIKSGHIQSFEQQAFEGRNCYFYKKADRPLPVISWNKPVAEIDRLIRALDYGQYANPLGLPTVWTGTRLTNISRCVDIVSDENGESDRSHDAPGTIHSRDGDQIKVRCKDGFVTLDMAAALPSDIPHALPVLTVDDAQSVSRMQSVLSVRENYWSDKLLSLNPLVLDCISGNSNENVSELSVQDLSQQGFNNLTQQTMFAIVNTVLSKPSGTSSFDIWVSTNRDRSSVAGNIQSPFIPFSIELNRNETLESNCEQLHTNLAAELQSGAFLNDLPLRIANTGAKINSPMVGISFSQCQDRLQGALQIDISETGDVINWIFNPENISLEAIECLQNQILGFLQNALAKFDSPISKLSVLNAEEQKTLAIWNDDTVLSANYQSIASAFETAASEYGDAIALVHRETQLSYSDLNQKANQLAHYLRENSLSPGQLVGVLVERNIDMVVSLLAILKCGCAYIPLDTAYPRDRLEYMVSDSKLAAIVAGDGFNHYFSSLVPCYSPSPTDTTSVSNLDIAAGPEELAYVIYTSGSTGNPKGVMVEQRNVCNFFAAMDQCIGTQRGTWLAVTSMSFDISVLEILWTLTRGFKLVLQDNELKDAQQNSASVSKQPLDLSLFYWNVATEETLQSTEHASDRYRLLLEGAKFADENGFQAVWNPERHFSAFGGSFPNPAVTCAAVAAITKNVDIRAGSCVAPLHSPIRIAEDWSVIDNLSNGRAGVAFAAGWAAPDFAIMPGAFENAKQTMFDHLETVQKLWQGEHVDFPGPKGTVSVRTLPRPVQKRLPVWITTAGNVDSYRQAATLGANVLTHLLGQSLEDLEEKIKIYQDTWKECQHEGKGQVTLMLHTFVSDDRDYVETVVKEPMKAYLKSAMFLVKDAAWSFPTFKQVSEETGATLDAYFESITDSDMDALLEHAFNRYYSTSGLFGTVEDALETVEACKRIGVAEIACLIDFGVDDDLVLENLPHLGKVNAAANRAVIVPDAETIDGADYSIAAQIKRHQVTHLQCTPSLAKLLMAEQESRDALAGLQHMLVGGEALPPAFGKQLRQNLNGRLSNMYGPTETTIWSTTQELSAPFSEVKIGKPIANTTVHIVDGDLQPLPPGVPGELLIGGAGVVRGYLHNDTLTNQRFINDHLNASSSGRLYRTGDLAAFDEHGSLRFLGRLDHQIKLNGFRIELQEIEASLCQLDYVEQAIVVLREDNPGVFELVAYTVVDSHVVSHPDAMRTHLQNCLPEFMVPGTFVQLPELPLTPNGKVDRNALPEPVIAVSQVAERKIAPANQIEQCIQNHWMSVLGLADVGTRQNFFDIGGHSLKVIEVLERLKADSAITTDLKIVDLFRYTTIESLAAFISTGKEGLEDSPARSNRASSRKAAMNRKRRGVKTLSS